MNKIEKLQEAKKNVKALLDNGDCSIGFHDLTYWAGVVVRLREEIKKI